MDQAEYERWWQLHVRVARDDLLTGEEKRLYEVGRVELEKTEDFVKLPAAKQAREQLVALDAERDRLEQRRKQLDCEIAALESNLSDPERQFLGVKG
jgi:hypothetical protein